MNNNLIKEGSFKKYFKNGQLKEKGTYLSGRKNGIFEEYFENGQLKFYENYLNGSLDGLYEEYFEDGELMDRFFYKKGHIDIRSGHYSLSFTEKIQDFKILGYCEGVTRLGQEVLIFNLSEVIYDSKGNPTFDETKDQCQCVTDTFGVHDESISVSQFVSREIVHLNLFDFDKINENMYNKKQNVYYHKDLKIKEKYDGDSKIKMVKGCRLNSFQMN